MSKPVLVVLVAPPVELARMQRKAYDAGLPVKRDRVVQSRMVAGLEGVSALSWIEGVEDLEQAQLLLDMLRDMVRSLAWSYQKRWLAEQAQKQGGGLQEDMFNIE